MTKKSELYKCNICGNLVEVIKSGEGELVCCGEAMELIKPQIHEDEKYEHHIPVIIEHEDCNEIQVGKKPHPMENEHYIEFVEVYTKDNKKILRHYFNPKEEPSIKIPKGFDIGKAIAMCNIHGLWEKP